MVFMSEVLMMGLIFLHNSRFISMIALWRLIALPRVYFNNKTFGNFDNETYLRPFSQ